MENIQIRLPKDELKMLNELAKMLHLPQSEVTRNVLDNGLRGMRMKIALEKYIDEEFTLCKAAEFANVSIQRMARYAAERGIPFFREDLKELKRDIVEAEDWL